MYYVLRANGEKIAKSKSYESLFNWATNCANCTNLAGKTCTIEDDFGVIDTFKIAPMQVPEYAYAV